MTQILNLWWVYVIVYLIFIVVFTQFVRVSTKKSKHDGALTVLLQLIAGVSILIFIPFFEIKVPTDYKVWILLLISVVFYAINDRLHITSRKNLDVSVDSVLRQSSNVFIFIAGILFFKESASILKILGILLIICSNVFVLYNKGKFKLNKYIWINIISTVSYSIAMCLDVGNSSNFNLPIYIAISLLVPAIMIIISERINLKELKEEYKNGNKKAILIGGISWSFSILVLLKAYSIADVTIITPLCALSVMLNIIASYVFLKEKSNITKNIIASIGIIVGVLLITVF